MDLDVTLDIALTDAPLEQLRRAAASALFEEGEAIMADSKEHYVPVEEGVLRGTGHVQPPEQSGDEISVTMAYGGPAEAYAIKQHEDLTLHHPALDNPGGYAGHAKYLETPVMVATPGLPDRLAARIRVKVGG